MIDLPFGLPSWLLSVAAGLGVLGLFGLAAGVAQSAKRRRGEAIKAAGAALAFTYAPRSDDLRSQLSRLPLFAVSGRHACEHVLFHGAAGLDEYVFEHTCVPRHRDDDQRLYPTTAYACRRKKAAWPPFTIEPRSALGRLAAVVSQDGLPWPEGASASARFLLRGDHAEAVARFVDAPFAATLAALRPDFQHQVDAAGDWAMVCRPSTRLAPEALAEFIADGRAAVAALTARVDRGWRG